MEPGYAGAVDLSAYPALMHIARTLESRPAALNAAKVESLGPTIFSAPTT
jgi:hypothetical protein